MMMLIKRTLMQPRKSYIGRLTFYQDLYTVCLFQECVFGDC